MNKVAISNNKIMTATITPATMPTVMEEESTSSLLPFLPELARVDLCEKMIGKDHEAASKRENTRSEMLETNIFLSLFQRSRRYSDRFNSIFKHCSTDKE